MRAHRSDRSFGIALAASVALVAVAASLVAASPAVNVTPLLISRGTFPEFKVTGNPANGDLFKIEAKGQIDVIVRQHTYLPGGNTGWHAHPYPVLITVKQGELWFFEYDDPTCTPTKVKAGGGYVDSGRGHLAINPGVADAVDYSVILAPVGATFRTELLAPNPYCGF